MKTKGLTIQEAIKSGLPHKLPEHTGWTGHTNVYSKSEILREDWQIKVPKVSITRENLAEAWDRVIYPKYDVANACGSISFNDFCEELGL